MLRGKPLAGNKLYEYVSVKKCLNVSCYELTPDNVPAVLEQIKKFRPKFIHAYPSAVDVFIRCAGNIKKDYFTALKGLFLGSEFLDPEARLRYENFFAAPVCSWYGHTECALHGGNLPGDTKLVFFPFYGHLELVDDQGNILYTRATIWSLPSTTAI